MRRSELETAFFYFFLTAPEGHNRLLPEMGWANAVRRIVGHSGDHPSECRPPKEWLDRAPVTTTPRVPRTTVKRHAVETNLTPHVANARHRRFELTRESLVRPVYFRTEIFLSRLDKYTVTSEYAYRPATATVRATFE